jgi:hypothetical protein
MASDADGGAQAQPGIFWPDGEPPGLAAAIAEVQALHGQRLLDVQLRSNYDAALAAVNQMIVAAGGRCRIVLPDAGIEVVTDASDNLIRRCGHRSPNGPHQWPA